MTIKKAYTDSAQLNLMVGGHSLKLKIRLEESGWWAGVIYTPYCSVRCANIHEREMYLRWVEAAFVQLYPTHQGQGNSLSDAAWEREHTKIRQWIKDSTGGGVKWAASEHDENDQ